MAVLPDYVTGTITLANGSTTVTGTGTMFQTAAFRPGDTLQIQNLTAIIASVNSNTSLTLTAPWTGVSLTNAPYRARYLPDGARVTAQTTTLIQLLGNGNLQALSGLDGATKTLPFFTGSGTMDALAGVADTMPFFTGPNGMGRTGLTPFARTLLDDANAATMLGTLGLTGDAVAQMALSSFGEYLTSAVDMNAFVPGQRGLYAYVTGSANFPENSGLWWVETQRIYGSAANSPVRQTATLYNQDAPRIYTRMRKADGNWGLWRLLTTIEGENSNGWFARLADGTQICFSKGLAWSGAFTQSGSVYYGEVSWTFPASFSASPLVSANTNASTVWDGTNSTLSSSTIRLYLPYTYNGPLSVRAIAVGRWF